MKMFFVLMVMMVGVCLSGCVTGHNRLALDVPAKGAEFDIMIETRDAQHTQEIMDALRDKGYPPRSV